MEPTTSDVFKARFVDCHFYEQTFPKLQTEPTKNNKSLTWQIQSAFWNDPRTSHTDTEVQRILHLTTIIEHLPDSFADAAKITRSHIPAANTPSRIQMEIQPATTTAPRAKRGRPVGSMDKQPRQRKAATPRDPTPSQPATRDNHEEIAINYISTGHIWDRRHTTVDHHFAYHISQQIEEDLSDPKTIREAQSHPNWPEWEKAIHLELDSLISRQVFGPITQVEPGTHLTGCRWTFVKK